MKISKKVCSVICEWKISEALNIAFGIENSAAKPIFQQLLSVFAAVSLTITIVQNFKQSRCLFANIDNFTTPSNTLTQSKLISYSHLPRLLT